jgi:hypothetical protein
MTQTGATQMGVKQIGATHIGVTQMGATQLSITDEKAHKVCLVNLPLPIITHKQSVIICMFLESRAK